MITNAKPWYYSKTLWVNIIFIVGLITSKLFNFNITTDEGLAVIIVINLVLRAFTGKGLTRDQDTADMLNS